MTKDEAQLDEILALQQRQADEITELREHVAEIETTQENTAAIAVTQSQSLADEPSSRRNFLRSAGVGTAAAAGAVVASTIPSSSVAAANGDAIAAGLKTGSTSQTRLVYESASALGSANILTVQDQNLVAGANAAIGATATGKVLNGL